MLLRRIVIGTLVAVLLLSYFPFHMPMKAASSTPVEVVCKEGPVLTVVEYNGVRGLYLPGNVNRKQVTVRYTGTTGLYCPRTKKYLAPGTTGTFDLSENSVTFLEKDPSGGVDIAYAVQVMGGSKAISSLYITLNEGTTLAQLHQNKENKGSGKLLMLSGGGEKIYDGALDTINGRGNTSFTQPGLAPDKKSYSIKLAQKAELVKGAGKAKKWALLHMRVCDTFDYDWTGLCNLLGYQTYGALMGDGYADIKAEFVDVYIDGAYRGVYILAERVAVNAGVEIYDAEKYVQSSSDEYEVSFDGTDPAMKAGIRYFQYTADAVAKKELDISGGYLLEVNTPNLEEPCGFETERGMLIDIKAPEVCTKEQVSYIARYFQLFENALYSDTGYNEEGHHYSEYVDMESLATMMLTYAFFKNWELFRTSTYMYMDTADSAHPKLTFGPAWDFETGAVRFDSDFTLYSTHQLYVDEHSKCYNIIGQLTTKADFQQLMFEKQQTLGEILEATLGRGSFKGVTRAETLWKRAEASLEMNWARWGFESILDQKDANSWHKNNYAYYANNFVAALLTRWDTWKELWDAKSYLLGLTVNQKASLKGNVTLTAVAAGKADGYQWYRLGADNTLQMLSQETKRTLLVQESGTYYCVAYGANNAYYSGAKSGILSNPTLYLISPPIRVEVKGNAAASGPASGGSTTQPSATSPSVSAPTNPNETPPSTDADAPDGEGGFDDRYSLLPVLTVLLHVILIAVAMVVTLLWLLWSERQHTVYWMYRLLKRK